MSSTDIPVTGSWEQYRLKVVSDMKRLERSVESARNELSEMSTSVARLGDQLTARHQELQTSINQMIGMHDKIESRVKDLEKDKEHRTTSAAGLGALGGGAITGIVELLRLWF